MPRLWATSPWTTSLPSCCATWRPTRTSWKLCRPACTLSRNRLPRRNRVWCSASASATPATRVHIGSPPARCIPSISPSYTPTTTSASVAATHGRRWPCSKRQRPARPPSSPSFATALTVKRSRAGICRFTKNCSATSSTKSARRTTGSKPPAWDCPATPTSSYPWRRKHRATPTTSSCLPGS